LPSWSPNQERVKQDAADWRTKAVAFENITTHPKYRKMEMDYSASQQRAAETLMYIESLPLRKDIKDKLVNTLATR
jgi:hypothetical protein